MARNTAPRPTPTIAPDALISADAFIAPHLAAFRAEKGGEIAALRPIADVDLEQLELDATAAREAERELRFAPDRPLHSNGPRDDLVEASRRTSLAADRLTKAREEMRRASSRIAVLEAEIGADAAVQALRSEYEVAARNYGAVLARTAEIEAALPALRVKRTELAEQRVEAERAERDRIVSADVSLAEILGEPTAAARSASSLSTIERAIADHDACIRRAEEALEAIAHRADELRTTLRELADQYRRARARTIELRWAALMRAADALPLEYAAACRIRGEKPTGPTVDDIAVARTMARIDGELAPIPSTRSTPESEAPDDGVDYDAESVDAPQVANA